MYAVILSFERLSLLTRISRTGGFDTERTRAHPESSRRYTISLPKGLCHPFILKEAGIIN